jgi:hypothetical protein
MKFSGNTHFGVLNTNPLSAQEMPFSKIHKNPLNGFFDGFCAKMAF